MMGNDAKTAAGEELARMMDAMTGHQLEELTEVVRTFWNKEEQQKAQQRRSWIKNVVFRILEEYAEQTDSITGLKKETEEYMEVVLENKTGFDILDDTKDIKAVLMLADYIGIERTDDSIRMNLIFAVKMK